MKIKLNPGVMLSPEETSLNEMLNQNFKALFSYDQNNEGKNQNTSLLQQNNVIKL